MPRKSADFRAWGGTQLFFVLAVISATAFGMLAAPIQARLDIGAQRLGWLGGIFFATYAASQLAAGFLLPRMQPRWLLAPSALAAAAGSLLLAHAESFGIAVLARALCGLGLGTSFVGVIYVLGRRFRDNFAFMSALGQSIANLAAAGLALGDFALPGLVAFPQAFVVLAAALAFAGACVFVFADDPPECANAGVAAPRVAILSSGQFWAATVFYCGTFGSLLAFADLWDIQFQANSFGHGAPEAAALNAMIPLGVTAGGLALGAWASRTSYVAPARLSAWILVACLLVLALAPLPAVAAGAILFVAGCALGSSTLALAAIYAAFPAPAAATASSLAVTAAYIFGSLLQPLVGAAYAGDNFSDYRRGMLVLVAAALGAAAASHFMNRRGGTRRSGCAGASRELAEG